MTWQEFEALEAEFGQAERRLDRWFGSFREAPTRSNSLLLEDACNQYSSLFDELANIHYNAEVKIK